MVPKEYKIVPLRDCPVAEPDAPTVDMPKQANRYWRDNIESDSHFKPDQEQFYVLLLNSRMRVMGHILIGLGDVNTVEAQPRETFRPAILAAASSVVIMHNHPSGDPTPSDNDIELTKRMVAAGTLLGIPVNDHVVIGAGNKYASVRETINPLVWMRL